MTGDNANPALEDTSPRVEQLGIDPTLAARIAQSRRRLLRFQENGAGGPWAADCLSALDAATLALRKSPRRARAVEAAWMAVHLARQALCLRDNRATLIEIAHEVEIELSDHFPAVQGRQLDIERVGLGLVHGKGEPAIWQRQELYSLAIMAAAQHRSDWHRANHLVQRRFRAALAVLGLLSVLVVVMPFAFEHISVGQGAIPAAYSWAREAACILAVLVCGALGALLSVLVGREKLQISSVEHYILVATYRLRPVVGAASALVFFILWESGILQMADAGHRKAGYVSGTLLLLTVVAGFSERFLLGQIEKLSAVFQRAAHEASGETPSTAPDPAHKDAAPSSDQPPPKPPGPPGGPT